MWWTDVSPQLLFRWTTVTSGPLETIAYLNAWFGVFDSASFTTTLHWKGEILWNQGSKFKNPFLKHCNCWTSSFDWGCSYRTKLPSKYNTARWPSDQWTLHLTRLLNPPGNLWSFWGSRSASLGFYCPLLSAYRKNETNYRGLSSVSEIQLFWVSLVWGTHVALLWDQTNQLWFIHLDLHL